MNTTTATVEPRRGSFASICLAIEGRRRAAADLLRRMSESPANPRTRT